MDDQLTLAIVGHVDHGKSTTIGRLLADTGVLPEGKLEQIRQYCAMKSRPFEYAYLLDALHNERSQGITIDAARVFFKSMRRRYLVMDTPGHLELLKNMVTGASQADAALFIVDAQEGLRENSLKHAHMLSLLGLSQVIVLVNKMDLVSYSRERFEEVRDSIAAFMKKAGLKPLHEIPISGITGENLAGRSRAMDWYSGSTLLEALDGLPSRVPVFGGPFRMPVQDIYEFRENGDGRRIIAGQVESGKIAAGEIVTFYPSLKSARVKTLETFGSSAAGEFSAGQAAGLTFETSLDIARGELAAKAGEPAPVMTDEIRANIFWLGREPLARGRHYTLKAGTMKTGAQIEKIERLLDATTLEAKEGGDSVARFEVAQCVLKLDHPIAFDHNSPLGRFVLVENFEIQGGGIICPNRLSLQRNELQRRHVTGFGAAIDTVL